MKKESKICPLCNKACIIQYKTIKISGNALVDMKNPYQITHMSHQREKYDEMIMCSEQQKENEQTVLK